MNPLSCLPHDVCLKARYLFCDIDDTLTSDGRIPACAFTALWRAHDAGLAVVPVTGRPAGWCDHIARMWPVAAVVGENGALAYGLASRSQPPRMMRLYAGDATEAQAKLAPLAETIPDQVPGCKVSADQPFRLFDLAIDFCEEVPPLTRSDIDRIAKAFRDAGATAKISSIHVNGWYDHFDKLTMCRRVTEELLGSPLESGRDLFVGDSPNDEPMFRHFDHAIGVANIKSFADQIVHLPRYITEKRGGEGFAEFVDLLIAQRTGEGS